VHILTTVATLTSYIATLIRVCFPFIATLAKADKRKHTCSLTEILSSPLMLPWLPSFREARVHSLQSIGFALYLMKVRSVLEMCYCGETDKNSAHDIRNRLTKQFQAVNALAAQHRWCLTGTPIQNDLDDLGAQVTFLKVPILEKAAAFRNFITRPIQSRSSNRFKNLRTLLESICLRRTKDLLDLPEPIPQMRRLPFTPFEQAEYNELRQSCRLEIDKAVSGHRKGTINSTVLESLLKLRLYCNNGSRTTALDSDEILTLLQQYDQNICSYCSGIIRLIDSPRDTDGGILLPSCSHLVCQNCLPTHRAQRNKCPLCTSGTNESIADLLPSLSAPNLVGGAENSSSIGQARQYPSKLVALLSDIKMNRQYKR
jgi:SWI/SNF-related matrix-associated actin-dependent regulator of chromatin subfamily A3